VGGKFWKCGTLKRLPEQTESQGSLEASDLNRVPDECRVMENLGLPALPDPAGNFGIRMIYGQRMAQCSPANPWDIKTKRSTLLL